MTPRTRATFSANNRRVAIQWALRVETTGAAASVPASATSSTSSAIDSTTLTSNWPQPRGNSILQRETRVARDSRPGRQRSDERGGPDPRELELDALERARFVGVVAHSGHHTPVFTTMPSASNRCPRPHSNDSGRR